jgi:hypothetical protein
MLAHGIFFDSHTTSNPDRSTWPIDHSSRPIVGEVLSTISSIAARISGGMRFSV